MLLFEQTNIICIVLALSDSLSYIFDKEESLVFFSIVRGRVKKFLQSKNLPVTNEKFVFQQRVLLLGREYR